MTRTRRAFLATTGLAAVTAGCLGGGSTGSDQTTRTPSTTTAMSEQTSTTTTAPSRTNISLLLNWKPSGLHVPYFGAKAKGYYANEGLTVSRIKSGQGSGFSAKQAGLGNEPFVVTSASQVLETRSRGLSPVAVGVVMQRSPTVLFTARDAFGAKLTDPSQLRGKTVGTGPGMVHLMTKLYLQKAGVRGDVDLVSTGYNTVQQLLAGKVDVAGGVFGDVVDARHHKKTIDTLPVSSEVDAYGHVIATSESFAKNHPDTVRAFLRATARGSAWGTLHPSAAIGALVDAVPSLSQSKSIQLDKWKLMANQYVLSDTVRSKGWGFSRSNPWSTLNTALGSAGDLGNSVDASSAWTNTYLDTNAKYISEYASVVANA